MKTSFKTTILIAAICEWFYAAFIIIQHVVRAILHHPYQYDLLQDIFLRMVCNAMLAAIIIACIALYKFRPLSVSKSFRILTYILTALLVLAFMNAPFNSMCRLGILYFWPPFELRVIIMILGGIWFWYLSKQEATAATPLSFKSALVCGIIIAAIPMICEVASGISLLFSGHILYLHSSGIWSWVRYIVPTILLCWYSIVLIKQRRLSR